MANVHDLNTGKPVSTVGGGGGGDTGERVAKLEACVEHIQSDLTEIKGDLRSMLRMNMKAFLMLAAMVIASTLGLAFLMAKGFHWL